MQQTLSDIAEGIDKSHSLEKLKSHLLAHEEFRHQWAKIIEEILLGQRKRSF